MIVRFGWFAGQIASMHFNESLILFDQNFVGIGVLSIGQRWRLIIGMILEKKQNLT